MSSQSSSPLATTALVGAAAAASTYAVYKFASKSSKASSFTSAYILAGDIGGTNSRLALFDPALAEPTGTAKPPEPIFTHTYRNLETLKHRDGDLTYAKDIILPFLTTCFEEQGIPERDCIVACFAVAGPVRQNRVVMTNVGDHSPSADGKPKGVLLIDGNLIEATHESYLSKIVRLKIVNDFVGQGYGALDLSLDDECLELVPGSKDKIDPLGPKVCVGAGTGLGECFLTISSLDPDAGYECYPSEGGHVEYAPRSDLEIELLKYLKDKFKQAHRVSVERVVSGKGLANVYEFLAKKYPDRVDKAIHSKFVAAGDMQGAVVGMNAGIKGSLMEQAMHIMVAAYGSEVGSSALKFIPTGEFSRFLCTHL